MSEPRDDTAWAERLMKAERENRCGDTACMTRRTAAAIRVLTGGKEHQDYCWAVETFEVEMGVRDTETVGAEPSNAMLDAALREQEPGETLRAADLRRALRANRHAPDIARDPMANQWNRGIDRALEIVDRAALEADRNPQETER